MCRKVPECGKIETKLEINLSNLIKTDRHVNLLFKSLFLYFPQNVKTCSPYC